MPEPRNLRSRSFAAFGGLATLLAIAGLATVGLESVSHGHDHLAAGHAHHHHHLYLGAHEHPGEDDHGQEHGHGHEDEAPAERPGRPGTATVSSAPALFQPVSVGVPVAGPVESSLLEPLLAPRPLARLALPPSPPRGPPLAIALPRL